MPTLPPAFLRLPRERGVGREGGEEDGGQKNSARDEKRGSGRSAGNRGVSERSPARGFTYGWCIAPQSTPGTEGWNCGNGFEMAGNSRPLSPSLSSLPVLFPSIFVSPSALLPVSLSRLFLSPLIPRTKLPRHAMHSLKGQSRRRAWNLARFLSTFCVFEFPLARTRPRCH